jgi:hypothetical protein
MRFGSRFPACIFVVASALPAFAAYVAPSVPAPPPVKELRSTAPRRLARAARFLSFRSIAAQVDNQVIANLLADSALRSSDLALNAMTGEIARCETTTCQVPMTIRVDGAQGPISLAFAVATPRGQLTDVRHVECNTGDCAVSLILERGQNVVSVGVLDALAQATGYTTVRINATRAVADRGRSAWF